IQYEASLDELTEAVKVNGETHDITTEKGRANQEALIDVAASARDAAEANLENGKSLNQVQADMSEARKKFIAGAESMGYTTTEANALADQLGLTKRDVDNLADSIDAVPDKTVEVSVLTGDAEQNVSRVRSRIAELAGKTVYVN